MFNRWKLRIARVLARASRANLGMVAAAVSFFGFLAIFPGIALVIALWSYAAKPDAIRQELALLADFLPPDAFSLLLTQVEALLAANSAELGWTTALSLLVALWSANGGTKALIEALGIAYDVKETRGVVKLNLVALAFTLGLISRQESESASASQRGGRTAPLGPGGAGASKTSTGA